MMTLLVMMVAGLFLEGRTAQRPLFPMWLEDAKVLGMAREGLEAYFSVHGAGVLPCPERLISPVDRATDWDCLSSAGVVVGGVPWRVLGLMPVKTASGDGVWYAVAKSFVHPVASGVEGRPPAEWGGIEQGGGRWAAVLFVPRLAPRPGEPVLLSTLLQGAQVVPLLVEALEGNHGLAR